MNYLLQHFFPLLLCAAVGFAIVLQGGINQRFSQTSDLNSILLINNLIALALSCALYLVGVFFPGWLPQILRPSVSWKGTSIGLLVPGMCGFLIILGMPIAISRIGVSRVLCLVIAMQLLGGLLWDLYMGQMDFSSWRVIGITITFLGATLALFS